MPSEEGVGGKLRIGFCVYKRQNIILKTDPDRVRQIVLNLPSNAVKFTNEGAVSVKGSTFTLTHPQNPPSVVSGKSARGEQLLLDDHSFTRPQ